LRRGAGVLIRPAVDSPDLSRLREGDRAEWNAAFHWLYPTALAVARNKLGGMHPGEVEDVALSAIEVVVEKVDAVKEVGELKKLCAAITHNKAVDVIRKLPVAPKPTTDEAGDEAPYDPPDPASPLAGLDAEELSGLLEECMAGLREPCRQLLEAAFLRGLKQREISEELGMPMGSVGVNLSRCLKKMGEIAKNAGIQEEMRMFLE